MDAGDSAFFAWAIGWGRHALTTDPGRLPHGNIFHPLRYTLGMDEPVLGTDDPGRAARAASPTTPSCSSTSRA